LIDAKLAVVSEGVGVAFARMRDALRSEVRLAIAEAKVNHIDRVIARLDTLDTMILRLAGDGDVVRH
jgi:hypothetical protein